MGTRTLGILNSFIKSRKVFKLGYGPRRSLFAASLHSSSCSVRNENYNPESEYMFETVSNLDDALNVFDKMIETRPLPSIDNFTKLLDFVTNMNHFYCSIGLFKKMRAFDVPLDNYIVRMVIKCYCSLYYTEQGLTVLGSCFTQGLEPDLSTYNTILNGFILEDKTHEADTLFKKLIRYKFCEPDIVTYNTMIYGLCKIGSSYASIALLRLMDGRGCTPNHVSYNAIIHGLCNDLMIDDAFKFFKQMVSHKYIPPNVDTYNSLIYAFCKLRRWDDVTTMLKQMRDNYVSPNAKTFSILVDAFCKQGKVNEAQFVCDVFFLRGGYHPDIVTYNSLLSSYCLQDEVTKATRVFEHMVFGAVKPNIDTYNRLLYLYSKHLMFKEFDHMFKSKSLTPKLNHVTEFIITQICLSHTQTRGDLCKPIDEKQPQIEYLTKHSYIPYLHHFCDKYAVEDALSLFHFMDGSKLNSNIDVYNILIDGASKCGRLDIARRLFHDLGVKGLQHDVRTYTVMIRGFCAQRLLKDAKHLFLKMEKSDCPPNSDIINDLIQGYMENKPFDDVVVLSRELQRRGYKRRETASIFF